MSKFRYAIL